MKHRAAALLLALTLSGCGAKHLEIGERAWTVSWTVTSTPVLAACTPWWIAWDFVVWGSQWRKGPGVGMWRGWHDGLVRKASWSTPLTLVTVPPMTLLEPLWSYLLAASHAHRGG